MAQINVFKSILTFSSSLFSTAGSSTFNRVQNFSHLCVTGLYNPFAPGRNSLSLNAVRYRKKQGRDYFPRASEQKRLKQAGWRVRMLTETGRRILMRRILRGRHVLSH